MENLAELDLLLAYHKGQNDIAHEFYFPCMARASSFDRAVAFFSSAIYTIAWPSLNEFIQRDGKMRVLCSPVLSPKDVAALSEGYEARTEAETADVMRKEIDRMLNDPYLQKPTRALAALVATGTLDLRVVFLGERSAPKHRRLFHDKVGIFRDELGNAVVFKGSMNETWAGLAADGNLESIDVFVTWGGMRERERVDAEIDYFESLWQSTYPTVEVREFPEVALDELISAAETKNLPDLVDEISREVKVAETLSADRGPGKRIPRPHQVHALQEWHRHDRRGILEHATGSGKTFTALCAMRDALERGEVPLVLVPSKILLSQWMKEIHSTFRDIEPEVLPFGAEHNRWREAGLLRAWTKRSGEPRVVVGTVQTAITSDFLGRVRQGEHIFLVADEVHRLGSPEHRRIFSLESGPRLGLSATPRRVGDPEGTSAIFDYFGDIVPPPFTITDAIEANTLTPYVYRPHRVYLTEEEQEDWDQLSDQIRQLYAQNEAATERSPQIDDRIKWMLIERARIIKSATGKVQLALNVLSNHYEYAQKWIVYCDTKDQLAAVRAVLEEHNIDAGEYHSEMTGDREQTLRHFETNGGILLSIRLLDEGVDIPSVSHALILASSKNPREFIQRRGRVLRKAPNKALAYIHDAIVLPNHMSQDVPPSTAILESELSRAIAFGQAAENPSSVSDLKEIALLHDLDYKRLVEGGYEDDE